MADLRSAAEGCRGCDLWEHSTQTVFGEGSTRARLVLVGEQPGDREDRVETELALVRPEAVVLLGATAAQSLLGPEFKVTLHRGEFLETPLAPVVMATIHPSAILRSRSDTGREGELRELVADLSKLAAELARRDGIAAPGA